MRSTGQLPGGGGWRPLRRSGVLRRTTALPHESDHPAAGVLVMQFVRRQSPRQSLSMSAAIADAR